MFIGSSLAASGVFTSGGFSLQIIKATVLEVGDKLLIYIQRAEGGHLTPWERQLCSQPEVNQPAATTASIQCCAWTPPVGRIWKVHQPYHYGLPPEYANTSVSSCAGFYSFYFFFFVKPRVSSHPVTQKAEK